jgi:glycerol-3-phosphate dehydrogenase (NAD(P)+)
MNEQKICYLGAGTWGIALSFILAENGHRVVQWAREPDLVRFLDQERRHPKLADFRIPKSIEFTTDIHAAAQDADVFVESVTSAGIRPVFEQIVRKAKIEVPVIITSKGIEQGSGLLLPEVVSQILGEKESPYVGCLSGPSHAEEVVHQLPTSVVCSSYSPPVMKLIQDLFTTPTFRIYPNHDIIGVCFGGALKNIMAIACGIADGLGFGDNTKAALMTRGLHEMRKLCVVKDCRPETLNGLSGLGDLCVTCLSKLSRNYRFGSLIAEGYTPDSARQKIGMAVEGAYTCVSARELARRHHVPVPIIDAVYEILYEGLNPKEAVKNLLTRAIKEEHL